MKRWSLALGLAVVACGQERSPAPVGPRVVGEGTAVLSVPSAPWGWAFELQRGSTGCLQARRDGVPLGGFVPNSGLRIVTSSDPVELEVEARSCADGALQTGATVEIRAWPVPMPRDRERVRLRLVAPAARPVDLAAVQVSIEAWLVDAGIDVELRREAASLGDATFEALEPSELAGLAAGVPASPAEVDVLLAGCLTHCSVVTGERTVEAYVPRVPAGFAVGDAIFVRGEDCSSGAPRSLSPDVLGKLVAHELGHFLGLEHVDEANLMHPTPRRTDAVGLTPEQALRLRTTVSARRSRDS